MRVLIVFPTLSLLLLFLIINVSRNSSVRVYIGFTALSLLLLSIIIKVSLSLIRVNIPKYNRYVALADAIYSAIERTRARAVGGDVAMADGSAGVGAQGGVHRLNEVPLGFNDVLRSPHFKFFLEAVLFVRAERNFARLTLEKAKRETDSESSSPIIQIAKAVPEKASACEHVLVALSTIVVVAVVVVASCGRVVSVHA